MPTTYRAVAKTDEYRTRDQIQPHFTYDVKRDSKAARAEAYAEFVALLERHAPHGENARAWLEVSDPRGYTRTLVAYESHLRCTLTGWERYWRMSEWMNDEVCKRLPEVVR